MSLIRSRKKKNIVVKANTLIKGKYSLPSVCQIVLEYIISSVNPLDDREFKQVDITIQGMSELLGIPIRNTYKEISRLVGTLISATIGIYNQEEEKYIFHSWFDVCKYDEKNGKLEFLLHKELNPYLLELKKQFTKYPYSNVSEFKGKYSTRFYAFAKMHQNINLKNKNNNFQLTLQEIKEYFECSGYNVWKDMKSRIIEPSINEINEKSDIKLTYKLIKQKRAVVALEFTITINPKYKAVDSSGKHPVEGQVHISDYLRLDDADNVNNVTDTRFMCKRNIQKRYIDKLIVKYTEKTVIEGLRRFNESEEAKFTKRPLEYLRGILNNISKEKITTNKKIKFTDYHQRTTELIEKQVEEIQEQQFENIDITETSKRANEALKKFKQKDN